MSNPPTYRSERAPDGTWTIYDVPVFSAHTRSLGGKQHTFDAPWLRSAVSKAQTRHAEGYYHPAHVRHHGDGAAVEAAGQVRFQRVAKLRVGGVEVPTIFADLVGVPQAAYDAIRRGELSYRSVEILDLASGEIDSLAFLDHEVPFFRYPLLRVSEGEDVTTTRPARSAALAYSAAGVSHSALFRYAEAAMDPTTEDKPEAAMAADPKAKARELLSALAELLGLTGESEEEAPAATPAPPMQASAAGPVELPAPAAGYSQGTVTDADRESIRLTARMDALTAQYAAMRGELDSAKAETRMVREASALREEGFGDPQITRYEATCKAKGEAAGAVYAQALRDAGPAAPPASWTGELPVRTPDDPAVMAYAARGPQVLSLARQIAATHARTGSAHPLPEYLAANLAAEMEA